MGMHCCLRQTPGAGMRRCAEGASRNQPAPVMLLPMSLTAASKHSLFRYVMETYVRLMNYSRCVAGELAQGRLRRLTAEVHH